MVRGLYVKSRRGAKIWNSYCVVITDKLYHHTKCKISRILERTRECIIFTRPLYIDVYYVHMYVWSRASQLSTAGDGPRLWFPGAMCCQQQTLNVSLLMGSQPPIWLPYRRGGTHALFAHPILYERKTSLMKNLWERGYARACVYRI